MVVRRVLEADEFSGGGRAWSGITISRMLLDEGVEWVGYWLFLAGESKSAGSGAGFETG